MKRRLLLLSAPPLLLAFATTLPSRSGGYYDTTVTRTAPACGQCHRPTPGAATGFQPIRVSVTPTTRVLDVGQPTPVTITTTGGQSASALGGFACDATAGVFSAGANTVVGFPATSITHSSSASRSWSFGYTAPTAPGLVEMFAVSNTVNGNRFNDPEDMWAFHGASDTATVSTPVRLFVNAVGVRAIGTSCVGGFGNVPVFGARQVPTVGNAAFALELHGAAPLAAGGILMALVAQPTPIDLGLVGVTGCQLFVDPVLTLSIATEAGDLQRAGGSAVVPLPIPSGPGLRNRTILFQSFFFDSNAGRPTPLTFSNALSVTLQ